MAHVRVNEAQQNGAFNNGAVGQQSRALCPYPYVWDRVRKACVLPDEFAQVRAYESRVPAWNWLSYLDWPGALPTRYSGVGDIGLGANCPEGSGRTAVYTGPEGPDGCRCSPGRIWLNGRCQSPQSVSQQAGSGVYESYKDMSVAQQMAQGLTDAAKNYFRMTNHSIACKLVSGSPVPGMPDVPVMMCSIDGGPYEHGAYAINTNPETAIYSALRNKAAEQVAQQTGAAPGSVYQHRSGREAVTSAVVSGQAAQTQAVSQAYNQPPIVEDPGTPGGGIGPGGSGGGGYEQIPYGGGAATDPGIGFDAGGLFGDIPWWVWVAAAGGAYMVMKKK